MGDRGLSWGEVEDTGTRPAMLLGEHDHTLDDKNRLTLPARFRHRFGDGIVVTRGMDGCLFAYTPRRLGRARRDAGSPRSTR